MKLGRKGKIKTNVIVGNILLIFFCLLTGIFGYVRINSINASNNLLYERAIVPLNEFSDVAVYFQKIESNAYYLNEASAKDEIEKIYKEIQSSSSSIDLLLADIKAHNLGIEDEHIESSFVASREDVVKSINSLYKLKLSGANNEANNLYKNSIQDFLVIEKSAIEEIRKDKNFHIVEFLDQNYKRSAQTGGFLLIFVLIASIAGIIITILVLGLLKELKSMSEVAKTLSKGDFNIEVKKVSDNEVGEFADSFRKFVYSGNLILSSIVSASNQVEAGAAQVSDSSMSLSQGTSEQASSIEELSASLQQISTKIKENDETSQLANKMSATVKVMANNGNEYMKDLLDAMRSIDESSKNISKVIKVIDDIAFQTNILALNAAVEAARAGQYGRGFAVVADEVRNLAAKSAAAVEETTTMIETSLDKITIGANKAELTAKAFNDILDNVNHLSEYGNKVARSSEEQSKGIEQINQGILQISDVVQSTSATAEETAAASEELSSQATLLRRTLTRFNYKGSTGPFIPLDENPMPEMKKTEKMNWSRFDKSNLSDYQNRVNNINLSDSEFGKY